MAGKANMPDFGYSLRMLTLVASVLAVCYLIVTGRVGDFADAMSHRPLVFYAIVLFALSAVLMCVIFVKHKTYTPSILLYLFFLGVPILGYFGYEVFIEQHGDFHGQQLSFDYPTFVWAVGTALFFTGVTLAHFSNKRRNCKLLKVWEPRRTRFFLWILLGVSILAAFVVISRIGYLPILQSGIDDVRWKYEALAGRYVAKLSRLFIVVSALATVLFFTTKRKKLYAIILLISVLGLTLYGERLYLFWAAAIFGLFYFKYYKPRAMRLVLVLLLTICSAVTFIFIAENRAGRVNDGAELTEPLIGSFFSEYSYYAFVVNEIHDTEQFLGENLFLSALVKILPRQIWAGVGVDKDRIMEKHSAVRLFGEWFKDNYGTRITPIGEAYAGYGLFTGVGLQLLLFGLVFGFLERAYVTLDKRDVRLCIVCFLLSLFMWLPVASLDAIIDPAVSYGGVFLLCQIGASKVEPRQVKMVRGSS